MKFLIFFLCFLCLHFEVEAQNTDDKIILIDSTSKMPYSIGFGRYVPENLKYPKKAKRKGIEGQVELSFIVEKDGSLTKSRS